MVYGIYKVAMAFLVLLCIVLAGYLWFTQGANMNSIMILLLAISIELAEISRTLARGFTARVN